MQDAGHRLGLQRGVARCASPAAVLLIALAAAAARPRRRRGPSPAARFAPGVGTRAGARLTARRAQMLGPGARAAHSAALGLRRAAPPARGRLRSAAAGAAGGDPATPRLRGQPRCPRGGASASILLSPCAGVPAGRDQIRFPRVGRHDRGRDWSPGRTPWVRHSVPGPSPPRRAGMMSVDLPANANFVGFRASPLAGGGGPGAAADCRARFPTWRTRRPRSKRDAEVADTGEATVFFYDERIEPELISDLDARRQRQPLSPSPLAPDRPTALRLRLDRGPWRCRRPSTATSTA